MNEKSTFSILVKVIRNARKMIKKKPFLYPDHPHVESLFFIENAKCDEIDHISWPLFNSFENRVVRRGRRNGGQTDRLTHPFIVISNS